MLVYQRVHVVFLFQACQYLVRVTGSWGSSSLAAWLHRSKPMDALQTCDMWAILRTHCGLFLVHASRGSLNGFPHANVSGFLPKFLNVGVWYPCWTSIQHWGGQTCHRYPNIAPSRFTGASKSTERCWRRVFASSDWYSVEKMYRKHEETILCLSNILGLL